MAKYTKKEIELLEIIAKLRGLVYRAVHTEAGLDAIASLNTPEYGVGLPWFGDLKAISPVRAALSQEFDRGYRRGVKDATSAMAEKVREISNWKVPPLAHEDVE